MKQREAELAHVEGPAYSARERLAGAFIIAAVLLLVAALAFSSQIAFLLADTFELHAEIDTAEGVSTDSVVKYAGIEIGKVTAVELAPDGRISLTLKIREKYHDLVRKDSTAVLNRLALLGDVTVNITRGDRRAPPLADGALIPVRETPTLDTLISRLAPAVDDIVTTTDQVSAIVEAIEPESVARIAADLRLAVGDVRRLARQIGDGQGTLGRLFNDEQLATDAASSVRRLSGVLKLTEIRLRELEPVLANAAARTAEMEALLAETTALVDTLDGAVESFNADQQGAISGVLLEARSALDEAEKTLLAIRSTWPFSSNAPAEEPIEALPPQPPAD